MVIERVTMHRIMRVMMILLVMEVIMIMLMMRVTVRNITAVMRMISLTTAVLHYRNTVRHYSSTSELRYCCGHN